MLYGHTVSMVFVFGSFGSWFLSCKLAPAWPPAGGRWVIWVIVFCVTQMTQKARIWRLGEFPALGHLGHFVTLQKSARVDALSPVHDFIGINPYIKIFYFLNQNQ